MSIFESLYNNYNEEKTKEHFNKEKYKVFIEKVERYCKKKKHNHKEEFLTQVFTHIMLADDLFRQAFLDKIEIVNGSWNFEAERFGFVENAGEKQKGEMDVFGTAENELLIIENKLNSEIQKEQPEKYKNICINAIIIHIVFIKV